MKDNNQIKINFLTPLLLFLVIWNCKLLLYTRPTELPVHQYRNSHANQTIIMTKPLAQFKPGIFNKDELVYKDNIYLMDDGFQFKYIGEYKPEILTFKDNISTDGFAKVDSETILYIEGCVLKALGKNANQFTFKENYCESSDVNSRVGAVFYAGNDSIYLSFEGENNKNISTIRILKLNSKGDVLARHEMGDGYIPIGFHYDEKYILTRRNEENILLDHNLKEVLRFRSKDQWAYAFVIKNYFISLDFGDLPIYIYLYSNSTSNYKYYGEYSVKNGKSSIDPLNLIDKQRVFYFNDTSENLCYVSFESTQPTNNCMYVSGYIQFLKPIDGSNHFIGIRFRDGEFGFDAIEIKVEANGEMFISKDWHWRNFSYAD